jgi:hypothetical protein
MIPEDRFSNTVADAADYEAYRSRGGYDAVAEARADAYDDARYDAASDARSELVQQFLDPLVEAELEFVYALDEKINGDDFDGYDPHPWTWHRHLLGIWEDEENGGEDVVREILEEYFEDDAESEANDYEYDNQGPCCSDFSCPCGG